MYVGLNDFAPVRTAAQIYAAQSKVRELTDANFWNIFYDRDKVVVVHFWARSCPACNNVAEVMVKVADRCYTGPHGRVKFYHAQWDKKVNPKIYERFGFGAIPVVFFYYTSTGRPPARECPLLEASLPDSSREIRRIFDPKEYLSRIQNILRRHPQNRGFFQAIDFYDRIDPHLAYLGRLHVPWCQNVLQIRLVSRADLAKIYNDNRKPKTAMSDWAMNLPGTPVHRKLFPPATDSHAHVEYDFIQIEQQTRKNSLILQVDSMENQRKQLDALFNEAKRTEKEQGVYIVLEVKNEKARLYFQRATPLTSSRDEFEFAYGRTDLSNGIKLRFVPGDPGKQVIGTLHTHYIKSTPVISQTTTTGTTTRPGGERVERIVHAVSEKDCRGAIFDQIVVYAMEADQMHKAMPNGRVINGMKKTFNVLVDALESFAGKTI
jgi:thiol-disulfide isomerase/thioredoxin